MNIFSLLLLVFSISCLQASTPLEEATRRLFKGVIPTKKLPLRKLPKEYFVENRKNVTVKRINDRMLWVHEHKLDEKERAIESFRRSNKRLALLEEHDRRILVKNPFELPYLAISYLKMIYNVTPQDELVFRGTGFRTAFNQVITAGHNVVVENDLIRKFCLSRKIVLKDYSFNRGNLSIEAFFGFREDSKGNPSYVYTVPRINGTYSFKHTIRDLAIVSLPTAKSTFLDKHIGAVGIEYLSDQPHEYLGKMVSIVGYPGEIKPRAMYFHNGPIAGIDHLGTVSYEVDTSKGNSGSPGFLNLKWKSKHGKFPACLVHTQRYSKKLNAGVKIDDDMVKFMQDIYTGKIL